uniref:procollagen-proline 4-dioxygenase n=1 Tax=Auxenochlorella protothecoides TaxID=3075 RepID=A0A1D1ZRX9_AUXPR
MDPKSHIRWRSWLRACTYTALLVAALAPLPARALDKYLVDTDRFPGWKGELPSSLGSVANEYVGFGALGEELWRGRVEQVSWEPRAFVFHNFLSDAECDHLMHKANSTLTPSTVVDSRTGGSMASTVRTSSGTWFSKGADDIIDAIEQRIALVTMIPAENGEGLQVLKYVNGQEYKAHTDYFHDSKNSDAVHGGNRLATMLMYLTTPEEGGETVFPYGLPKREGPEWSACARQGLAVKARRGDAIFFYGMKPDGSLDMKSTHASCPTLAGEKWSATKWMHVSEFTLGAGPGCGDKEPHCEEWAVNGECDANPGFMLTSCARACGKCKPPAVARRVSRKQGAA